MTLATSAVTASQKSLTLDTKRSGWLPELPESLNPTRESRIFMPYLRNQAWGCKATQIELGLVVGSIMCVSVHAFNTECKRNNGTQELWMPQREEGLVGRYLLCLL